jgi:signal transduction histidine kinase
MKAATALERANLDAPPAERQSTRRAASPALLLGFVTFALCVWATVLFAQGGLDATEWVPVLLTLAWASSGAALALRRPGERMGVLILFASLLGAIATLATAVAERETGIARDVAELARAMSVALLPAAGLHVLLALPDGALASRALRRTAMAAYVVGAAVGVLLWSRQPSFPAWPVVLETVLAGAIGVGRSHERYVRASALERQRMQWVGIALTVAAEVVIVVMAMRVLLDWPPHVITVAALATLPVPIALALGSSRRFAAAAGSSLTHAISLAGLTAVVCAVYFVIVLGLGRVPDHEERTLLLLSLVAAGVAALLYGPARARLSRVANRLVYGEREAPDAALRTLGNRLSRAIPLDELLLQLAESLRKTLALATAEVWTGSGGALERSASDPERGPAKLSVAEAELPIVARAGVSGNAWIEIWLPSLMAGREGRQVRVAPIVHSGELLGLIVAERPADSEPFVEEEDEVLSELAREFGLAMHNVQLDSALAASLEELRRQADELRASRARIVAATDAERRRIERDLHDGAQQHLVALAVNLRIARQLNESGSAEVNERLEQLREDLREAIQQLRDFAHGIYPPLLMDAGLGQALSAAAARAPVPTRVQSEVGRHPQEVEAAVYFCCLEALQNAGKYAGEGAKATVRIHEDRGRLVFEVTDDGRGFDPARKGVGAGFTNMNDRLGAIGGNLRVESSPGAGTKLTGTVPLRL